MKASNTSYSRSGPDDKTAPVTLKVDLKPDGKTASATSKVDLKPDVKTAPVTSKVNLKPDDKTAPVTAKVVPKPDDKTAPVSMKVDVKPDDKTAPISERVPRPTRRERGPKIPNYTVLHRIGKGGYGEVWLARGVAGTLRAVKVVRRADFDNERAFEREFEGIQHYEPVSREHPSLVDILHVGRDDKQGFYYYVMELADDVERGREINVDDYQPLTLLRKMRRGEKSDVADCLEFGIALADGLGKLHANKLAHRDIKPSNVIYVRDKPQLADPGLVANSGQDTFVGTEGYVPPEGPGTPQADLYSLGMVLYEMNTGKDRMDFPELPTIIDPSEPNLRERSELNTIICRACAPRPKQRYADAKTLSDALSTVGVVRKAPARLAWKLAAAAVVILLLGGGVYGGMMLGKRGSGEPVSLSGLLASWSSGDTAEVPPPATTIEGNVEVAPAQENPTPKPSGAAEPPPQKFAAVVNPPAPIAESAKPNSSAAAETEKPVQEVAAVRAEPISPVPSVAIEQADPSVIVLPESPDQVRIGGSGALPPTVPKGAEADTTPSTPPPPPAIGGLRISSFPPNAIVFLNDEEIGAAPLQMDALAADDYKLRFELANYKQQTSIARVEPGKTAHVDVELQFWSPPAPGQPWDNSAGMRFEPVSPDAGHRTVGAVRSDGFETFAKNVGPDTLNFKVGLEDVIFADSQTRQAYCEWMTANDRAKGYLDEKLVYMQDIADPLDGSPNLASFHAIVGEYRFGRVIVSSEPSGADVFKDGKKIGVTPLEIEKLEIGPIAYEVRKAGFKGAVVEGLVDRLEPLLLEAALTPNQSVIFDQEWTNHIGMKFVPVDNVLAGIYETRIQDYEKYWVTLGTEDRYFEPDFDQGQDHPVVNIRIGQARAFCEWLTEVEREQERIQPNHVYRLPTDEEWSHLAGLANEVGSSPEARDGKIRGVFPWGDSWPPPAGAGNFADTSAKQARTVRYQITGYGDGFVRTAPVGSFKPNEQGLYDIAGNVWEYCNDNYSARRGGGPYPVVMRGGSWQDYRKENLETAHRNVSTPDRIHPLWGFRVVLARENEPIEIQAAADDSAPGDES